MHPWAAEVHGTACLAQLSVVGREEVSTGKGRHTARNNGSVEDRRSEQAAHRQALLAYIMF